jgi:2-amino-4-hydroxy-6-hydroxymethyldihydropteridine diphosphokinase
MVVIGYTTLAPAVLLAELLTIEYHLGRIRRGVRNEPRTIDLDLILHSAHRVHTRTLTLPHPRAHQREFVMKPLGEISAGLCAATAATYSSFASVYASNPGDVGALQQRR